MNLRSALLGCSSGQLSRIAAAWKLQVEAGTLRRELVEVLAERLLVAAGDAATWTTPGEHEREVIRLLVRAGGRHEADLLTRRLGRDESAGTEANALDARIEQRVAGLIERGLLFRVFEADEQRRGVYLMLPDELLSAARDHLGERGTGTAPIPAELPVRVAHGNLAADLFVLASALRREAWSSASRGLAGRSGHSVGQILGRLRALSSDGPGDPGRRWRFLLWLSQRAGWISRDAWPTPDEDAVERLLIDPNGLPSLALSAGPVSAGEARTRVSEQGGARQRQADALQLLSELDGAAWWSVVELVRWLAEELVGESEPQRAVRGRSERDRLGDQIRRWLVGRWFWLGLVDWGWDGTAWTLVTPTDLLRALATGRPTTATPRPSPCLATGSLRMEAPTDADLAALYRAERYLAFAGGDGDRRRYGLTPASFDRGIRLGGDPDEIRGLLERLLDGPVPPDWLAAIDIWSSGSSRLVLGARLLLSSDRPETLDEALAIPPAREAVTDVLTPRHAIVAGERVADVLAELARAGLPVEIDPGLRAEPADHGRSAALANGVAETAWVALEVLRRLAPEVVAEQRDLQAARGRLDAVLAARVVEALNRRAATIVAAIANRRRPRSRGRVV